MGSKGSWFWGLLQPCYQPVGFALQGGRLMYAKMSAPQRHLQVPSPLSRPEELHRLWNQKTWKCFYCRQNSMLDPLWCAQERIFAFTTAGCLYYVPIPSLPPFKKQFSVYVVNKRSYLFPFKGMRNTKRTKCALNREGNFLPFPWWLLPRLLITNPFLMLNSLGSCPPENHSPCDFGELQTTWFP